MPTPDQLGAPFRAAGGLPYDRRYGGRIMAQDTLPIHAAADSYTLEGSGTIRTLPSAPIGETIFLRATSTPTFVNSARLICPGGVNYVASAGDFVIARSLGDWVWQLYVITYSVVPASPTGRISLSSTAAVPTTDITAGSAVTINYIDVGGGVVPVWSNTLNLWMNLRFSGALSMGLDSNAGHTGYHAASQTFDVCAIIDPTLGIPRLATTKAAQNDFSDRGSNISDIIKKNGFWVNSLDGFLRVNNTGDTAGVDRDVLPGLNQATYLGSLSTVAAGQSEQSKLKQLVFNAYNGADMLTFKNFTGTGYNYNGAYRQVNADAANQTEMLIGLPGFMTEIDAQHCATSTTIPTVLTTCVQDGSGTEYGIGTVDVMGVAGRVLDTGGGFAAAYNWRGKLGPKRYTFKWMEASTNATTGWLTWNDTLRNGMRVIVRGM